MTQCCDKCLTSKGALTKKQQEKFGGICGTTCDCHWPETKPMTEEKWEKIDKKILELINYLGYETALYANRPKELYEKFPYPEFGNIHDAIQKTISSHTEKLIGELEKKRLINNSDPEALSYNACLDDILQIIRENYDQKAGKN